MGSISGIEARPDWYRDAFHAGTASLPRSEHTEEDVDLVLAALEPPPGARILDLACGAGRHAIELARRGFEVVGVDISAELIEVAVAEAELQEVDTEFIQADLRDLTFADEFEVVLNLHDGAIGYFEDDEQNHRTFETIARALRGGGRNLAQVPSASFAGEHVPERTWKLGSKQIELLERRWSEDERYAEGDLLVILLDDPGAGLAPITFRQRIYTLGELFETYASVGMTLREVIDDSSLRPPGEPSDAGREISLVAEKGWEGDFGA